MRYVSDMQREYLFDESHPIHRSNGSVIYKAHDVAFNRDVCLKILTCTGGDSLDRMKAEVTAQARAGNVCANIPVPLDYFTAENGTVFCIVMQWIGGTSLRASLPLMRARQFVQHMIALCEILQAIHGQHIWHKDIKPENIVLTPGGTLYLLDFNISIGRPNLRDGSECYRAPEMSFTGIATSREQADLFAVGVMLYEYFAKVVPQYGDHYATRRFSDDTKWSYFRKPSEIVPTVPPAMDAIIEKCMARSPKDRYRRAQDLKNALKDASRNIR